MGSFKYILRWNYLAIQRFAKRNTRISQFQKSITLYYTNLQPLELNKENGTEELV